MADAKGNACSDVVIVGASLAGLRAAETVTRIAPHLRVIVVGQEEQLPYDRPPLSKKALTTPVTLDDVALRSYGMLSDSGVEFRLGTRATDLDIARRELHTDSGTLSYGAAVLACGCDPIVPPFVAARPNAFTLRTWQDVQAMRTALADTSAAVAVLGAGFIGGEVASSLDPSIRTITMIDRVSRPLNRFGSFVAESYSAMHADARVAQYFGDGVVDVIEGGRARFLLMASGAWVPADIIVVGAGVRPATSWLEQSALTIDNGIVCDDELRSAEGVFAAGDVARWRNPRYGTVMRIEHWTNAAEQGRIAGLNAANTVLGIGTEQCATVPYFWSDQHGVRMQFAGWITGGEQIATHRSDDGSIVLYGRQDELVGVFAFDRRQLFVKLRTLLKDHLSWRDALSMVGVRMPTETVRGL